MTQQICLYLDHTWWVNKFHQLSKGVANIFFPIKNKLLWILTATNTQNHNLPHSKSKICQKTKSIPLKKWAENCIQCACVCLCAGYVTFSRVGTHQSSPQTMLAKRPKIQKTAVLMIDRWTDEAHTSTAMTTSTSTTGKETVKRWEIALKMWPFQNKTLTKKC